jgi:hypothetical protein
MHAKQAICISWPLHSCCNGCKQCATKWLLNSVMTLATVCRLCASYSACDTVRGRRAVPAALGLALGLGLELGLGRAVGLRPGVALRRSALLGVSVCE